MFGRYREIIQRLPMELFFAESQQHLKIAVGDPQLAVGGYQGDARCGVVERLPEAGFAFFQTVEGDGVIDGHGGLGGNAHHQVFVALGQGLVGGCFAHDQRTHVHGFVGQWYA